MNIGTLKDFPTHFKGRRITNRGVHIQPTGHHGYWMNDPEYWTNLFVDMGMSWVVMLTEGDGAVHDHVSTKMSAAETLLEAGIIPIIRDRQRFPWPFTNMETVDRTVEIYGRHGLRPFWILYNEPFDEREWRNENIPPDDQAWDTIMECWANGARIVAEKGGYVGFPDGPCYDRDPFEYMLRYNCKWIFDEGLGFYAGHHYGKNRHRDYPYDMVTRHGYQLTEEAYDRALDDYADDPRWKEETLTLINMTRRELYDPTATALTDDTCWRGWEKIVRWSVRNFGYVVPMAMTEGGWVPRDRAGTGPNTDIRVPHTTPNMVAAKTLQMYDTPSPFFAIAPWLAADEDMGGSHKWPFDAWHGWAYSKMYGRQKPVIHALKATPPKERVVRACPLIMDIEGNTRDWLWAERKYTLFLDRVRDAEYRLVEIHEVIVGTSVVVVNKHGLTVDDLPDDWYVRADKLSYTSTGSTTLVGTWMQLEDGDSELPSSDVLEMSRQAMELLEECNSLLQDL